MKTTTVSAVTRAVWVAIALALATALIDLSAFSMLDRAALAAMNNLPPIVAPVWLALPRLVEFILFGAILWRLCPNKVLLCAFIYLALVFAYFFWVRFGGGIWAANGLYAKLTTYAPFGAIPAGLAIGILLGRTLRWAAPKQ